MMILILTTVGDVGDVQLLRSIPFPLLEPSPSVVSPPSAHRGTPTSPQSPASSVAALSTTVFPSTPTATTTATATTTTAPVSSPRLYAPPSLRLHACGKDERLLTGRVGWCLVG